jgi:CRP/FNR family transcriptional regulator, anaerobic regulatory protein
MTEYTQSYLKQKFALFNQNLIEEIYSKSNIVEIIKDQQILKIGQYISVVPIVLSGTVKVYTYQEDKEFLLYYIREYESCIMSFTACIQNEKSQIYAFTESKTILLLMPVTEVLRWSKIYPEFNAFYLKFYQRRYLDLIQTLQHLVFDHLDERIMFYLKQKAAILNHQPLKLTHKIIANDLATTREVVSRILKKLEENDKIKIENGVIKIL